MTDWTIQNGLLQEAEYIPSPNMDARPDPNDISLLILHGISLPPGEFGGGYIQDFFSNQLLPEKHPYFKTIHKLRVSAHLLVERSGQVIQFVPFHHRAWHAGLSSYKGRSRCNDFAIGIELESTDDSGCTVEQYTTLQHLIPALLEHYPNMKRDAIVGHSDVAPDRKTDPGSGFDWQQLNQSLS